MSIASAPSEIIRLACAIAASVEKKLPPSLKLSGVTLRIPNIVGRWDFDGQANVTPALPPDLRRVVAWTALDASPASPEPAPMAAGSRDAAEVFRREKAPQLRHP